MHVIQQARNVHLSGYYNLRRMQAQVPVLFQKAQEAGAVTSLDPQFDACEKWDSGIHDIFPHLDLLKVNELEANGVSRAVSNCSTLSNYFAMYTKKDLFSSGTPGAA